MAKAKPKAKSKARLVEPKVKPTKSRAKARPAKAKPRARSKPQAKPAKVKPQAKSQTKPAKAKPQAKTKAGGWIDKLTDDELLELYPKLTRTAKGRVRASGRLSGIRDRAFNLPKRPTQRIPPPRGFKLIATDDVTRAQIRLVDGLKQLQGSMPQAIRGMVSTSKYKDGTMDGELWFVLPDDWTAEDAIAVLYDRMADHTLGRGYWVSMGARFNTENLPAEILGRYPTMRGLLQIETHYQPDDGTGVYGVHHVFNTQMIPGMTRTFPDSRVYDLFVRKHWNPYNEQPKRG